MGADIAEECFVGGLSVSVATGGDEMRYIWGALAEPVKIIMWSNFPLYVTMRDATFVFAVFGPVYNARQHAYIYIYIEGNFNIPG